MINPTNLGTIYFPNGCEVTIDPERKPKPGDAILVNLDNQALFRVWIPTAPDQHNLTVINPLYQTSLHKEYSGNLADVLVGLRQVIPSHSE